MPYYADLSSDLPASYKRKRVIFYRQGLKIYGLLPYILNRKLKAQFFSNSFSAMGGHISTGSFESNWTAVPYGQSRANIDALLDWLYSDKGFKVAIATPDYWDDDIFSANVFRMPPHTWFPVGSEAREGFLNVIEQPDRGHDSIMALLALPEGGQIGGGSISE